TDETRRRAHLVGCGDLLAKNGCARYLERQGFRFSDATYSNHPPGVSEGTIVASHLFSWTQTLPFPEFKLDTRDENLQGISPRPSTLRGLPKAGKTFACAAQCGGKRLLRDIDGGSVNELNAGDFDQMRAGCQSARDLQGRTGISFNH